MKTKSLRLDMADLEVTIFEAGRTKPVPEQALPTADVTCPYSPCPWTE